MKMPFHQKVAVFLAGAVLASGLALSVQEAFATRSGTGSYSLPAGNPAIPQTLITAAQWNSNFSDLANEMTDSLSRSGKGGMLVPFRGVDGLVNSPTWSFTNETGTGLYRAGAGNPAMAVLGVQVQSWTSAGTSFLGYVGAFTQSGAATNTVGGTFAGNGTGAGVSGTGGATGVGGSFTGGATNGVGVTGLGTATSAGGSFTGGPTSGTGAAGTGGGPNGAGISGQGTGTGPGGSFTGGGASGNGVSATGGAPNGVGLVATGTGTGVGAQVTGGMQVTGATVITGGGLTIGSAGPQTIGLTIGSAGAAAITGSYRAGVTNTPPGAPASGTSSLVLTVTGATVLADCLPTANVLMPVGLTMSCVVTANTCTIYFSNITAGVLTPPNGTYFCRVFNQ